MQLKKRPEIETTIGTDHSVKGPTPKTSHKQSNRSTSKQSLNSNNDLNDIIQASPMSQVEKGKHNSASNR